MSRKLVIPGVTFTGPMLRADDLETAGTLLLVEPGHPTSPWPVGVPSHGATIPNVSASRAAATMGVAKADVAAQFTNIGLTGAKGLLERSGKGGLHGITSQTASVVDNGARVLAPAALKSYLRAHPSNDYYYSLWYRVTRVATHQLTPAMLYGRADGDRMHTMLYKTGIRPPAGNANRLGVLLEDGFNTTGTKHSAIGVDDWTGGVPAANADFDAALTWGPVGFQNRDNVQATPSWILYRHYVEDLTVSGRTYAQVEALDVAMQAAAFGAGGRYNADTFTAASTVA